MFIHIKEVASIYAPGDALPGRTDETAASCLKKFVGPISAEKILRSVGVHGLARRGVDELTVATGITRTQAKRIVAARELAEALSTPRTKFVTPAKILVSLPLGYARFEREVMTAIVLNAQLEQVAMILISAGGAQVLCMTAADVLRPVLRMGGNAFILLHNHPSGDATPSTADVIFTNKIAKAALLVGLQLLDHIVIAERGMVSFYEAGLLPTDDVTAARLAPSWSRAA
jgi:DNA repair protein RadC